MAAGFGVAAIAALAAKARHPHVSWRPLMALCFLWLAYGYWEQMARDEGWNIRVDLLVGWPLLFGATTIALALFIRSVARAIRARKAAQH
jgi:hypothetical protein